MPGDEDLTGHCGRLAPADRLATRVGGERLNRLRERRGGHVQGDLGVEESSDGGTVLVQPALDREQVEDPDDDLAVGGHVVHQCLAHHRPPVAFHVARTLFKMDCHANNSFSSDRASRWA